MGGVIFVTPGHILERLYSFSKNDVFIISNSLPFVLHMSESRLDPKYLNYETDFNSILKGIRDYIKAIPLDNEKNIKLHYYCNIHLNTELEIVEMPKKSMTPFKDYIDYESRLISTLKRFVSNAQSFDREYKYDLVTTISKGYDAAACSAIAKEVGCEKVVTFNQPQKYAKDCGADIAIKLGYSDITVKNADEYLLNMNLTEAEFVSSGDLGTWIIFSVFENEFKNNIVLMGERGDKIWDKNWMDSNGDFRFKNEIFTATSLIENRLRVGYINVPMPLFGASQWPSIHKISNSDEMKPYSVGGNYDRPIPRRILETRGIERELFGMKKKGAGFNYRFDNLSRIKKRMSKQSFHSFEKFYRDNKRCGIDVILAWIRFLWQTKTIYLKYLFRKTGIKFKSKTLSADACSNPGAPSYLFNWGIHEMIKRYEKADINRWWLSK